jgi:hypothetical protein
MPNTCQTIIQTGPNKGKLCYEVNRYCRHKYVSCPYCNKEFSHKSSMERHISTTCSHKIPILPKPATSIVSNIGPPSVPEVDFLKEKVFLLEKQLDHLRSQFGDVNRRVDEVEREPRQIIVIGDQNILNVLTAKLGGNEDMAINFLAQHVGSLKRMEVVNKLYLEGVEPDCYPIACKENYHFRYLDRENHIVDDHGGEMIVKHLGEQIQEAILEASNKLVTKYLDDSDEPNDELLNTVHILQNNLVNNHDKKEFRDMLAQRVYHSKHPFFQ